MRQWAYYIIAAILIISFNKYLKIKKHKRDNKTLEEIDETLDSLLNPKGD